MEKAIPRKMLEKDSAKDSNTKEKGNLDSLKNKELQDQGHTRRMVRERLQKKQKETERSERNERENRKVIIITRHKAATKP